MFSCELCGRGMKGRGRNVTIEGAQMLVCPQCASKFGSSSGGQESKSSSAPRVSPSWVGPTSRGLPPRPTTTPSIRRKSKPKPKRTGTLIDDMILIEDYADAIRTARQKKGFAQEELAQRVGERVSTLQAIESGRLKPTRKTIRGLERELGISLLEPIDSIPIKRVQLGSGADVTLGDRVIVKRKKSQKSE